MNILDHALTTRPCPVCGIELPEDLAINIEAGISICPTGPGPDRYPTRFEDAD